MQIASLNKTKHLYGIIPLHFSHNRYENDIHYFGGCLLTSNMNWNGFMFAFNYLPPSIDYFEDFNEWKSVYLERVNNNNGPWIHQWIKQRFNNKYWLNGSVYKEWSKLYHIPIFMIGGQIDGYIQSIFKTMDNLCQNNHNLYCMIGPWEHQFPHLSMLNSSKSNIHFLKYVSQFVHYYSGDIDGNSIENKNTFQLPQFTGFLQENIYDKKMMDNKIEIDGKWIGCDKWPKNKRKYQRITLQKESNTMIISNSLKIGKNYSTYFPLWGNEEFAQEQSFDDKLSTCFKTNEICNNGLIIFGGIKIILSFIIINDDDNDEIRDDIEGMIIARLCLVNNKNKQCKLLTWKCFNLNMLFGNKKKDFMFLKRDKQYKGIILELPDIFEKIIADNYKSYYLRLSLSSNYWPIVFPNKKLINIKLLQLPIISIPVINDDDIYDMKLQKYSRKVNNNIEWIRNGIIKRDYYCNDVERRDILYNDEGCFIIGENKWLIDHIMSDEYVINDINDPLSCIHVNKHKFVMAKTDYVQNESDFRNCYVSTKCIMSCDYNNYYIKSCIDIKLNGNMFFTKEWNKIFQRAANIINHSKL